MLAGPSPSVRMTWADMDSRLRGNDVIPVTAAVIPVPPAVIPAEAGIQG